MAHGSFSKKISLNVVCGLELINFISGETAETEIDDTQLGPFSVNEDLPIIIYLSTN